MWTSVKMAMSVLCLLAGGEAVAGVPSTAVQPPKKQLSGCMTRQMTVSRSISYYDAMKVCKALIKSQEENLIASNEAKPAHAR